MIYSVVVKPGSKKGPLVLEESHELTVFLRERPIEGKANQVLIHILAEHFGVTRKQIVIKNGVHSRKKLIEINEDVV